MFTKLTLIQVVVLALTAQAAPIVHIDPVDARNFPQQAERAILPRGINIPWKWVGPSILGTVTLDHLGFETPQNAAGQAPTLGTAMPTGAATASTMPGPSPGFDNSQGPSTSATPAPAPGPIPIRPRPSKRPISWDSFSFPNLQQPPQQRDLSVIDSHPSPRSDTLRRSDATHHVGRGINIPWRWVGPSIAGTVALDHLFMDNPPTPIGGPETTMTYPAFSNAPTTASPGPSTNPTHMVRNEGAPSQVSVGATLRTRGASTSDFETRASPAVTGLSGPASRGMEEAPLIASTEGYEKLAGSVGSKVSKVPFKWLGLGVLGGVVLDHLLSPLPRPYFHRQPNLRALDYSEHADVAGSKRSELEARMNLPWKWILGGTAGGLTLDRILLG
ncbi:hypothetical protein CF326_g4368 [Tilletia indica]|uniref:Uncharacterized protein n=1 Tax=Tilletia indica TaxID=43049 RepID=A0A177T7E4_9BASI|nr:hypothetical protein CF326_g4368 [Tilletia indica]KAE8244791.1 hypothetical protein A4X13_0g6260 [Tilletia indica]